MFCQRLHRVILSKLLNLAENNYPALLIFLARTKNKNVSHIEIKNCYLERNINCHNKGNSDKIKYIKKIRHLPLAYYSDIISKAPMFTPMQLYLSTKMYIKQLVPCAKKKKEMPRHNK